MYGGHYKSCRSRHKTDIYEPTRRQRSVPRISETQSCRLVRDDDDIVREQHPVFDFIQERLRVASADHEELLAFHSHYQAVKSFVRSDPDTLVMTLGDQVPWNQNVSQACASDFGLVIDGARNQAQWAFQFVDAFGKPEAGILEGNIAWLGSFDECMKIEASTNSSTSFRGKYCLGSVGKPVNLSAASPQMGPFGNMGGGAMSLRIGMCFPDSCSDPDTLQILKNLLTLIPASLNVSLEAYGSACQPRSYEYDAKAIVAFCIIAIFALMVAVGTLYDVFLLRPMMMKDRSESVVSVTTTTSVIYPPIGSDSTDHGRLGNGVLPASTLVPHENGSVVDGMIQSSTDHLVEDDQPIFATKEHKTKVFVERHSFVENLGAFSDVLVAFSLYSNGQKIFSTSQPDKSLTCIHGIRFLSMTWVLLGHTYAFSFAIIRDLAVLPSVLGGFWFQAILNAAVSVDTFFTMSGLLVSYLFILNYEKTKKFPVVQYYVHRYWRLTAVYAVIMGVYLGLFKYLNSGPQWNPSGLEIDSCRTTWWTNFLYVNNLVRTTKQCMGWTWYLANDMQFYWISPLILFPLVKKPVIGLAIMAVFFVAHVAATAVISSEYKLSASLLGGELTAAPGTEFWDYFDKYYTKPWTRIGPYLVGMFFGYILAKYRKNKVRIPVVAVFALWIVAAVTATAVLYGLWDNNSGKPMSPESSATYNALHRSAWAAAVCWVIFACVNGYGGFVNTLLSWKALIPLTRLTYCCYLIHIPVMLAYYFGLTTTSDFSHAQAVYYFFGTLLITYGFAFLFTICCESPLLGLEKVVERSIKKVRKGKDV